MKKLTWSSRGACSLVALVGYLEGCLVTGFEGTFVGQSTCPDGWKCAPCQKPFTGEDTGACN